MIKSWSDEAWEDFTYWTEQDKKTLKRILKLLKDIDRNGYEWIGKPERLSGDLSNYWSRRIDDKNRIVLEFSNSLSISISNALTWFDSGRRQWRKVEETLINTAFPLFFSFRNLYVSFSLRSIRVVLKTIMFHVLHFLKCSLDFYALFLPTMSWKWRQTKLFK